MLLTFALLLGLAASAADPPKADAEPAGPIKVRRLTKDIPANARPRFGGKEVTTFTSLAELEKAFDKAAAAKLAKHVKFPGEVVVRIIYEVGGPPFPALEHEVEKKKSQVTFFFKYPPGDRDSALRLGVAFFVVPKGTTVKYIGEKK